MDLSNYDGKIYDMSDRGFALRFKSGSCSFHYVSKENLKEAVKADFKFGYHKRVYESMPWGAQHTGYEFVEFENKKILLEYLEK